jgi:hypothetical protein
VSSASIAAFKIGQPPGILSLLYQQMDGPTTSTARKAFYGLNDDVVWTNKETYGNAYQSRIAHR